MYLVDTNVISELRKAADGRAEPNVQRWSESVYEDDLFLSAITVFESEAGILRLQRKDRAQAEVLRKWLHEYILPSFAERILVVDVNVALRCAKLHVPTSAAYRDSLIGATALVHNMTLVTRNTRDFRPMGVKLLNPWDE